MARGKFIVFEGIDGSGKTTQAKLLVERLFDSSKLVHVLLTREPYNSQEVRERLAKETNPYENAGLMAKLFIEDRQKHIKNLILPNLKSGIYVVSDRYKLSTIAYQSAQGLDTECLIAQHKGMPLPNITFFIDVPAEIAMKRSSKHDKKFEQDLKFQETLRNIYQVASSKLSRKGEIIYTIDGTRTMDEVAEEVYKKVKPILTS